jgi:predicted alpha/beta hydrolase family esterase
VAQEEQTFVHNKRFANLEIVIAHFLAHAHSLNPLAVMNWALPVTQKVAGSSLVAPAIRSRSSPETWVTERTVLPGSLKSKSYHPEELPPERVFLHLER